eukprot:scaffold447843_cov19-Prasinocladus_malaysianus.AAC.1
MSGVVDIVKSLANSETVLRSSRDSRLATSLAARATRTSTGWSVAITSTCTSTRRSAVDVTGTRKCSPYRCIIMGNRPG